MIRKVALLAAVALGGFLLWPHAFTVVPVDQVGSLDETFDPVAYVDEVWSDVDSTIRTSAADTAVLLNAITPDENGSVSKNELTPVTQEFGLVTPGDAHVFMVKVIGTITAVDIESSVGTMTVAVDGYDGPIQVDVYLGPRIPSDDSSVRDAVGLITFGDFRDQTEYGRVASEINSRVSAMLATTRDASLAGQQVTVYGAMTVRTFNLVRIDVSNLRVVPIAVEIG